jgi:hypothetical protein
MNIEQEQDIVEGLTEQYGFGTLFSIEGKIEQGTYKSPYEGDADLEPYMMLKVATASIYIYPYAIVGIVYDDDTPTFLTRMD